MLTPVTWCLGEVPTTAFTVHHMVRYTAVALGTHAGLAISLQLDIASQDDFHGRIHPADAVRQGHLGLVSNVLHRFPPDFILGGVALVLRERIAFPVVRCYYCHRSVPR